MYLSDREIKALLDDMEIEGPLEVHPFKAEQIQPCSIDLRVSNIFWKPSRRGRFSARLLHRRSYAIDLRHSKAHDLDPRRDWKKIELGEGDVTTIQPGHVLMGRIYERFRIPPGYAGKVEGRSSFARLGLAVHCTGDFINPGWHGYMPLQLFNAGPYPIRITPYLDVCQLMLVDLSSPSERNYGDEELQSKYVNDDGGPSLWWRDRRVKELQNRLGEVHATERLQREIIDRVRFTNNDVLDRFDDFVAGSRIGEIGNAVELLDNFAKVEDRRRLLDVIAMGSPAVLAAGIFASLFAPFAFWHVVLIVAFLVSCLAGLRGYLRRDSGYLGRRELENEKDVRS